MLENATVDLKIYSHRKLPKIGDYFNFLSFVEWTSFTKIGFWPKNQKKKITACDNNEISMAFADRPDDALMVI